MLVFLISNNGVFLEQLKNAIIALVAAVLRLETAVHAGLKERLGAKEQIDELKTVLKITYERLDKALADYKKGS